MRLAGEMIESRLCVNLLCFSGARGDESNATFGRGGSSVWSLLRNRISGVVRACDPCYETAYLRGGGMLVRVDFIRLAAF